MEDYKFIGSVGYLYSILGRFVPVHKLPPLETLRQEVRESRSMFPDKYTLVTEDASLFYLLLSLIRLHSTPMSEQLRLAEEHTGELTSAKIAYAKRVIDDHSTEDF